MSHVKKEQMRLKMTFVENWAYIYPTQNQKKKITWEKVEDNVEIGNSIIRRHIIKFLEFVAFLFSMTRRKLSAIFFDFYHDR